MSSLTFHNQRLSSLEAFQYFKPNVKKSKSKSKIDNKSRLKFNEVLTNFENIFNSFQDEIYNQLVDELFNFVINKYQVIQNDQSSVIAQYIPTALVNVGFGSTYSKYLQNLVDRLLDVCSNVIVISSSTVHSIFDLLLILQNNLFDDPGHEPVSFYSLLAKYYRETSSSVDPIVLIFKDFEELDSLILAKLFPIMHENLQNLPVILICCQSVDIISIQSQLPAKAIDCLLLESFNLTHFHYYFDKLMDEISFKSKSLFKIGPNIIDHFFSLFLNWNSSIENIYQLLKLCIFEHFYNRPYTQICWFIDIKTELKNLGKEEIKALQNLPSLKGLKYPTTESAFLTFLENQILNFHDNFKIVVQELRCYDSLRKYFCQETNASFLKQTFIPFLGNSNFFESKQFLNFRESIFETTAEKFPKLIASSINKNNDSVLAQELLKHFDGFEEKISENSLDKKKEVESIKKRLVCRTRGDFQDKLKKMVTSGQGPKKKIEVWKNEFFSILEKGLKRLKNPFKLPFHEIFCFDDISILKKYIYPCPRNEGLNDLLEPQKVLNCKCCSDFNSNAPTISIVYNLINDSPKTIDLKTCFDNFKKFIHFDESNIQRKKRKKSNQFEKEEVLSKYISAIQDLEFIGFIQTNSRKSDHVSRLVFK